MTRAAATTGFAPIRGRQPSIEYVPIDELLVDPSYQRSIDTTTSQKLIREIAANWDWDVFDVLKVSRRPDDCLFVIDGQHRRAAAALRGDIAQLPCVLKRCATPAEEARIFIESNRRRKRMGRVDDFRAALGAGDPEAMTIHGALAAAGFSLASSDSNRFLKPSELSNVAGLRSLLRRYGEEALADALSIMGEAFPDEVLAFPTTFAEVLIEFTREKPPVDRDVLFNVLLDGTTEQWAMWGKLRLSPGGKSRMIALRDLLRHRLVQKARVAA